MTPLLKKMNVKQQKLLTILNHPESFQQSIDEIKADGLIVKTEMDHSSIEWLLVFVPMKKDVDEMIHRVDNLMLDDAMLWFAYPKKSSKNYQSDITRDDGWQPVGQLGWEPVRQIAIDEDWSALRFRRVQHIKNITRRQSMAITDEAKRRTIQK